jgi:ethanolamine utilization microcompartment shell protein EutL
MKTLCTEVSLEEPLEVLKGCSAILNNLDAGFMDDNNSHKGISVIADLITDAVSRLEDEKGVQIAHTLNEDE